MRTPLPGDFNVANALAALGGRPRARPGRRAARRGARDGRAGARPLRADRRGPALRACSSTTRTRPTRSRTCCEAARRLTEGRLISVFGCGGDRDRDKRPLMGRAGAELSDLAVDHLRQPALRGPGRDHRGDRRRDRRTARSVVVEPDRRAAIALALARAEGGDTVVIAGKGHEQGQEFEDGRKIPFDDRDVAREELRRLAAARDERARRRRRGRAPTGAEVLAAGAAGAPGRAVIDSRAGRGRETSSSACRASAPTAASSRSTRVRSGAWGVVAGSQWAREIAEMRERGAHDFEGWVLGTRRPAGRAPGARAPLAPRARLPGDRDHRLDRQDLGQGRLPRAPAPRAVHASPENYNTEIGLPLAILAAPEGTEVLVLEMGMRGRGPDRRAVRDRRARRRRDHQRRPRPRRAARQHRGDRRDQGGGDRRAARRRGTAVVPAAARPARAPPRGRPEAAALRRRRRRLARGAEVSEAGRRGRWSPPRPASRSFSFRSSRRTTSTTRSRRSRPASRWDCRWTRWPSGRRG